MKLAKSWRDYPVLLKTLTPESFYSVVTWLCLNDLYFLLRYGMDRPFVENDWWFARCREVQDAPDGYLDLWAREHGKMQSLNEPTPTPNGWKAHGALVIGDELFGPDGNACKVVALSSIYENLECYEIEFDDGTKIKCGANHLWEVERKIRKRINGRQYRESVVIKTEDIFNHNHTQDNRMAVRVNMPLILPEVNLDIDPYVLGVWLGDDSTNDSRITCEVSDADEMQCLLESTGVKVSRTAHSNAVSLRLGNGVQGNRSSSVFMSTMCNLGVIGNKHIPRIYLRASMDQRLALLQGLMDTNGTCDMRSTAMFCTVKKEFAEQVVELCNTLGLKPRFRIHNGKYRGLPHTSYQVSFQAYKKFPVFRFARKLTRCKDGTRSNPRRYIVSCKAIKSQPMRCIQVDRKDGLYLTSTSMVTTHNSTVITIALTIQNILNDPEITVGIFSHTKAIAKSFLRVIKREFEINELLKKCFPNILHADPAMTADKWSEDVGIIVKRKGNAPEATVEGHGLVDGAPTGRHFQLRVYDDVVVPESVSTPDQMRKVIDALDMSNNLGKTGGIRRMIGTRYKLGDAYEEYIKRGIVKPRIYPATDNGRIDGNPVLFTQDEWELKLQDMSHAIIASQMLQNPLAEDSVIFQPDWFKLWPADKELPAFEMVFLSLDGAFSAKTTADDSCLGALGVFQATEGSKKYSMMILDNYMGKIPYPDLRDEVLRQYGNKFGNNDKQVDGIIIEDKASGSALIPELRRAGIPVYPYNPGSLDKTARANLISHLIRDGYLWLPESRTRKGYPMSWLSKGYEQMLYFPNVKNDDFVDMIVQALSVLDKMGFLRGKIALERPHNYWSRLPKSSYSG